MAAVGYAKFPGRLGVCFATSGPGAAHLLTGLLDAKVEQLCAKILLTFPDCTTKTLEELRKPKLEAWNRNKEDARAWLALNMMTEARSGFTAFNEGPKDDREVDFVLLRQKLAAGQSWVGSLHHEIQPGAGHRG